MATEEQLTPTSYIANHLTFNASGEGFWAFHWDTIAVSVVLGVLVLGFPLVGRPRRDRRRAGQGARRSSSC